MRSYPLLMLRVVPMLCVGVGVVLAHGSAEDGAEDTGDTGDSTRPSTHDLFETSAAAETDYAAEDYLETSAAAEDDAPPHPPVTYRYMALHELMEPGGWVRWLDELHGELSHIGGGWLHGLRQLLARGGHVLPGGSAAAAGAGVPGSCDATGAEGVQQGEGEL